MVERLSITLEKELLDEIDTMVDHNTIKNRSHAISVLVQKALGNALPRKAVILCGGKGTRFRPITYEIPKALMPVQGRPIIEHLLDLFKRYGVHDIVLAVGYLKERIKDYIGDGTRSGVRVSYIEEDDALGTGGPIRKARHLLREPFFVTNGDQLEDIDLADMYRTHKANKGQITIALTSVEDPSAYGVAQLSGSKILNFVEKPKREEAPSNFISAGCYIIEPDAVALIPDGFTMLEKDVFPRVASAGRLIGYPFSGQFFDTGTPERYENAIQNWKGIH